MKTQGILFATLFAGLSAASASATTIDATFVKSEIAPDSTQVSLPYFENGVTDIVFLKFSIPNVSLIGNINTFNIDVYLYDNNDGGGESGDIQFAQPGTNVELASFTTLNHFESGNPELFTISLTPDQIAQVLPSLSDGTFRIRISRNTGDFFVDDATATLDVTLTPEPATYAVVIAGLIAFAGFRRRLKNRRA